MTSTDINNATENATKSANVAPMESPAMKAELPSMAAAAKVAAAKAPDLKAKTPIKAARKAVAKKTVTAPVSSAAAKRSPAKAPPAPTSTALAKPRTKPTPKAPTKAATPQAVKPVVKVLAEKVSKQKKPKLVRDSFTIPKPEYSVLDDLKQRSAKIGNPAKKSELLRAGIKALAAMTDAAFKAALGAVPTIKTGRPAKD